MINNNAANQISSTAAVQPQGLMNNNPISGQMPGAMSAMPYNTTGNSDAILQTLMRDISIIKSLMQSGIINSVQGQHLMNYIINKANTETTRQPQTSALPQAPQMPQITVPSGGIVYGIEAFLKENPEFFNKNGRNRVLEYLKKSNSVVDKDEIMQIAELVEALEQSAVDGYLQNQAHEKSINDENKAAKAKLRANAQNSNAADANARVFTREQIGRMSGAEFAKNEKAIMEQLRNGLIR